MDGTRIGPTSSDRVTVEGDATPCQDARQSHVPSEPPQSDATPSGIDPADLEVTLRVLAELAQTDHDHADFIAVRRATGKMFIPETLWIQG